jgi:hypothetical protein
MPCYFFLLLFRNSCSRANLASWSTQRVLNIFGKYLQVPKWVFDFFRWLAILEFAKYEISWYLPNSKHLPRVLSNTRQTRQHLANLSNVSECFKNVSCLASKIKRSLTMSQYSSNWRPEKQSENSKLNFEFIWILDGIISI